jgi:hypothetical protein
LLQERSASPCEPQPLDRPAGFKKAGLLKCTPAGAIGTHRNWSRAGGSAGNGCVVNSVSLGQTREDAHEHSSNPMCRVNIRPFKRTFDFVD